MATVSRMGLLYVKSICGAIVTMPNVVSVRRNGCIRTGERTVKPRIKPLLQSKKVQLVTPLHPVIFPKIEDQVGRPRVH